MPQNNAEWRMRSAELKLKTVRCFFIPHSAFAQGGIMGHILTIVSIAVLLVGCGEGKPPEKTVFDPQVQAYKKARQLEGKLAQEAQKQREAVEAAEGRPVDAER